jgi:hypothetical protein
VHNVAIVSDLVSAVFGIVGALILAIPLLNEITDRRHWQRLVRFSSRPALDGQVLQKSGAEIEAERQLRDQLVDSRMGSYQKYRFAAFFGSASLLLAFIFLGIAAVDRLFHVPCTNTCP